ncbi:Heat shock protein. Metallo peptidase. MEROPS family M48B [Ferrithrix thermotolerans DSM 19514]|uniref:Protease HtpX homolog n=1 Tax=Ferrithrix thermotolerans DSM 19514 TaxID=1121881 RepID=A0A1M4WFQ0_9ACTN|nr:zinc metalloprotease HtpX [Ferrithrix thermotolerans]SHE80056.1 Heat shock protein. Metallo peptidase. MEROPS family M48B [Ferrithrix thermotolerans DSM 19514]
MAKTRFKSDKGLVARMGLTIFLLGALYVAFVAVLLAVGVQLITVVFIGLGILFVQYFFSDKIALFGMHGKVVTEQEAPELYQIVRRLCALANMPMPRVAVANTDMPNAFATGRNPKNAVVCVTTGLLRRLDTEEVEAVLAHELSHVAHRDVAVMTIASFLGMVAGILTRVLYYSELFGGMGYGGGGYGGRGGGRSNNNSAAGNIFAIEAGVMLVSIVVYAISFLLIRALSRYRELSADRSGAILLGRPSLLKSALIKITGEIGRIPTKDIRSAAAFNAFYFTPAVAKGQFSISTIFSTHPSLERRIAELDKLERELGTAE